jgi:hypothetical protein
VKETIQPFAEPRSGTNFQPERFQLLLPISFDGNESSPRLVSAGT